MVCRISVPYSRVISDLFACIFVITALIYHLFQHFPASFLLGAGDVVRHLRRRRAGAGRVHSNKGLLEAANFCDFFRLKKVAFCLTRKTHDDIGGEEYTGNGSAYALD